ncbi:MAG TPA: NAD-dependent succinate-semialdehyde dehydrogenase [Phycisphaerales bacterium]|nr:NAD-dependent succinate-semialdehyde dehydrogenase [Phycisphaerales bacterium]
MQTRNLINNEWIDGPRGERLAVVDPATDSAIAEVPSCGPAEVARAVDAAAGAFPAWRARPAQERSGPLRRLFELMMREEDRLARLMTLEQGKPLAEARGEIRYGASFVEWGAEEAKRVYGETIPASAASKRILVLRQPLGVVAAITPWNFPCAMITRKIAPALAAGCTVVVKPAEQTPLSALALGELCLEAGFPPGVVNIVTGEPEAIGGAIFADARVRAVSFTGSTEVGRILMRLAAPNITRLSLELGGQAPFIVFEDADLDAAVAGLVASKFRNAGQTCICANRVYVQRSVRDAVLGKLREAVAALKVGPGDEEGVAIGPLIDDDAVAKVERHIADAHERGGRIVAGGEVFRPRDGLARRFVAPTIIDGLTPDMLCAREETFGPVVPIAAFDAEEEALALANGSPFGLAAYFYTRDASRLIRVAEALEFGVVGANDGAPSSAQAPFGGVKHSGFGREGGRHSLDEYTALKYVSCGVA